MEEGITDKETVEIVTGIVLSIIVLVWSWMSKRKRNLLTIGSDN